MQWTYIKRKQLKYEAWIFPDFSLLIDACIQFNKLFSNIELLKG